MANPLKHLQVGQTVSVQHLELTCHIHVQPAGQAGPQVLEVGEDFVLLEDSLAGVRTRIPAHLISQVGSDSTVAAPVASPVLVAEASPGAA